VTNYNTQRTTLRRARPLNTSHSRGWPRRTSRGSVLWDAPTPASLAVSDTYRPSTPWRSTRTVAPASAVMKEPSALDWWATRTARLNHNLSCTSPLAGGATSVFGDKKYRAPLDAISGTLIFSNVTHRFASFASHPTGKAPVLGAGADHPAVERRRTEATLPPGHTGVVHGLPSARRDADASLRHGRYRALTPPPGRVAPVKSHTIEITSFNLQPDGTRFALEDTHQSRSSTDGPGPESARTRAVMVKTLRGPC